MAFCFGSWSLPLFVSSKVKVNSILPKKSSMSSYSGIKLEREKVYPRLHGPVDRSKSTSGCKKTKEATKISIFSPCTFPSHFPRQGTPYAKHISNPPTKTSGPLYPAANHKPKTPQKHRYHLKEETEISRTRYIKYSESLPSLRKRSPFVQIEVNSSFLLLSCPLLSIPTLRLRSHRGELRWRRRLIVCKKNIHSIS